jgi:hypothetical protein
MKKTKNKAAQAMAKLRWAKTTKEERVTISKKILAAKRQKRIDSVRTLVINE